MKIVQLYWVSFPLLDILATGAWNWTFVFLEQTKWKRGRLGLTYLQLDFIYFLIITLLNEIKHLISFIEKTVSWKPDKIPLEIGSI